MKFDIGLMRLAGALATYSSSRQSLIAQNIANADTPGYRARDLEAFEKLVDTRSSAAGGMKATRPGHIGAVSGRLDLAAHEISAFGAEAPNGNDVSLEDQMARSAEVKISHDLALGVYKTSLDILRLGLGRRR